MRFSLNNILFPYTYAHFSLIGRRCTINSTKSGTLAKGNDYFSQCITSLNALKKVKNKNYRKQNSMLEFKHEHNTDYPNILEVYACPGETISVTCCRDS